MFVVKMNFINILIVERPTFTQLYIGVGFQAAHLRTELAKLLEVYSDLRRGDNNETEFLSKTSHHSNGSYYRRTESGEVRYVSRK